MYLKSLELHGFKSFPNKTTLNFERGATVIIGPNGSGKSNISDAMRWVLGEMSTKALRGSRMEDVIFGGADTRRPMGFAEVSVTFDNTDAAYRIESEYDEITVTRRFYRSGDSEYFLNRKPCRLKDIHELFLNTGVGREGYSIIGQGRIAEILSKKSEDRRNIFEEAAGISKFRYRKTEAAKSLEETEANMLRVSDLLSELEARVGPLQKEAEKAKKFLSLHEEKKRADVSLWIYDTSRLHEEEEKVSAALKMSEHEIEMAADALESYEKQYDHLFSEGQKAKLESEKLLAEIRRISDLLYRLEAEYKVSENETSHIETLLSLCASSAAELEKQKATAEASCQSVNGEIDTVVAAIAALESDYAAECEKQQSAGDRIAAYTERIGQLFEEIRECESEASDLSVRLGVLESSHASDNNRKIEAGEELRRYQTELLRLKELAESHAASVAAYEEKIADEEKTLAELASESEECRKKFEKTGDKLSEVSLRRDTIEEKARTLSEMEAHFEGYGNGVRYVMQTYRSKGIPGAGVIYGPLSTLIGAKPEHIIAAETALAANIQSIVCDNEETAKAAIRSLKQSGQGRTTFYPLTSMHPQDETEEMRRAYGCPGYIGTASDIIECDEKFRVVLDAVLGRTLVFDHLDHASECAKKVQYRVKIVTLDGQIIHAGGSYTGGSVKTGSGIMTRTAQIESLRRSVKELNEEAKRLQEEKADLNAESERIHQKMAASRQQIDILCAMANAERGQLEAVKAKLSGQSEMIGRLDADISRLEEQTGDYDRETAVLREKIEAAKEKAAALRERRIALDAEKNGEEDEREKTTASANALLIRLAEARKDRENAEGRLSSLILRIAQITEELQANERKTAGYREQLGTLQKARELNRENAAQLDAALSELNRKRTETEQSGIDYEKKQNDLRQMIRDKTAEKEVLLRAYNKYEAKLQSILEQKDNVTAQIWEDYELTYSDALTLGYPPVTDETREETAATQQKLKNQLRALGSVNVNSIEEYESVKSRYDTMSSQMADLSASRKQLEGIIAKIEGEMKRSFSEAFEKINENFKVTFRELFGGGQAELLLTDPDNILESGIDIKAAPPGKIVKSLMLLSGGEQAFVAIALLFAVLKVNPSPFCILDEIEAALDEVNVARFADYIKKFTGIQFILITHRRGTMEAADRMYGVTMPEQGVSKVIPLNVYEFESRKDEFIG